MCFTSLTPLPSPPRRFNHPQPHAGVCSRPGSHLTFFLGAGDLPFSHTCGTPKDLRWCDDSSLVSSGVSPVLSGQWASYKEVLVSQAPCSPKPLAHGVEEEGDDGVSVLRGLPQDRFLLTCGGSVSTVSPPLIAWLCVVRVCVASVADCLGTVLTCARVGRHLRPSRDAPWCGDQLIKLPPLSM
jgi:hypothetical protein